MYMIRAAGTPERPEAGALHDDFQVDSFYCVPEGRQAKLCKHQGPFQ